MRKHKNRKHYKFILFLSVILLAIFTGCGANDPIQQEKLLEEEAQNRQPEESESPYTRMSREELEECREQIEQEFCVYESSVKYHFDPEEFYNAVIDGLIGDRFSPFSICKSYEEEEWKKRMEAYYGEDWEELGER